MYKNHDNNFGNKYQDYKYKSDKPYYNNYHHQYNNNKFNSDPYNKNFEHRNDYMNRDKYKPNYNNKYSGQGYKDRENRRDREGSPMTHMHYNNRGGGMNKNFKNRMYSPTHKYEYKKLKKGNGFLTQKSRQCVEKMTIPVTFLYTKSLTVYVAQFF